MTLLIFLIGVIIASGLMTAAVYGFLVLMGILVNPMTRMMVIPALLILFITMLAAGMGRSKLKPMTT